MFREIGEIAGHLARQGWLAPEASLPGLANESYLAMAPAHLPAACAWLAGERDAILTTMVGTDEREAGHGFRLYYIFSLPGDRFLGLVASLPAAEPRFPSVTPYLPAAHWYEREVHDLLGLLPVGHPDLRPLILHEGWPEGHHPLRKDFPKNHRPPRVEATFPYQRVEGEGVMEVPVGPIHAGVIEPGHFRLSVEGENILNLEARLFYSHRGMEKEAEGLGWERGLLLAERICGQCSFSHAVAFCQAVERLAGTEAPAYARYLRVVGLELERLANHLGDIGNLCAGTGYAPGAMSGARMREEVLRLNEALAGNRFLRGLAAPGGVRRAPDTDLLQTMDRKVEHLGEELEALAGHLLAMPSFLDRVQGTGQLPLEVVRDLGVVGPAARASGLALDYRREHPHAAYGDLGQPEIQVPACTAGDVHARLQVRVAEVATAVDLIRRALPRVEAMKPTLAVPLGDVPAGRFALGYTESPRGANIHWVMAGMSNTIARYRVRSASYTNWPAVPFAVQGDIVPDFPLISKSFELCHACCDR